MPLRSWIRDQSTTPITVRGGVEVEVKVRVDPICNADAGNPSEITALAASIFLTTDTGDTRSYVTDRSWGWRDGSTGLKPSPLWPDNPGGAPPGAQWLTHIRRSPTREVFWTSLVKNLPANVCEGVSAVAPPAAGGGGGSGRTERRGVPVGECSAGRRGLHGRARRRGDRRCGGHGVYPQAAAPARVGRGGGRLWGEPQGVGSWGRPPAARARAYRRCRGGGFAARQRQRLGGPAPNRPVCTAHA